MTGEKLFKVARRISEALGDYEELGVMPRHIEAAKAAAAELSEPTLGMYRALVTSFGTDGKAKLFVGQWGLGSFREDWKAAVLAAVESAGEPEDPPA